LLFMMITILKRQDFGPMKSYPAESISDREMDSVSRVSASVWRVLGPVAFLIGFILIGLYVDGVSRMGSSVLPFGMKKLALAFGEANSPVVLIVGSVLASVLAFILYPKEATAKPAGEAFFEGTMSLFQPVLILVGAWILSSTLNGLGAVDYLGGLLEGEFPLFIYPALIFLVGACISFTTGTSWGTMGLLMPLSIPVVFQIAPPDVAMELIPLVAGAVFSGAVFGDHCSPISDTTIVSSIACDIDPVDHVRTQFPYAAIVGLAAVVLGFIPAGLYAMGIGSLLLSGFIFLFLTLFGLYRLNLKANLN